MAQNKLTTYQQKLIDQLLVAPKVKEAADHIGMSYDYARKVVTKTHVIEALLAARQRVSERAEIDAAWVLRELVAVYERCMTVLPVLDSQGNPTGEYKFDAAGANRALENIGKHTSVNAFRLVHDNCKPIDQNWRVEIVHTTKDAWEQRHKPIEHG